MAALTSAGVARVSLHGRRLQIGDLGNLMARENSITPVCTNATISVSAESTNVRTITIQLKNAKGDNVAAVTPVEMIVFSTTAMTALSTGGSTGIALTTGLIVATIVAKKHFRMVSDATGAIVATWTDTGTDTAVVALVLPNGVMVASDQFANT